MKKKLPINHKNMRQDENATQVEKKETTAKIPEIKKSKNQQRTIDRGINRRNDRPFLIL
jgi:hypothetical protein